MDACTCIAGPSTLVRLSCTPTQYTEMLTVSSSVGGVGIVGRSYTRKGSKQKCL